MEERGRTYVRNADLVVDFDWTKADGEKNYKNHCKKYNRIRRRRGSRGCTHCNPKAHKVCFEKKVLTAEIQFLKKHHWLPQIDLNLRWERVKF
jgi:hypothetical protein